MTSNKVNEIIKLVNALEQDGHTIDILDSVRHSLQRYSDILEYQKTARVYEDIRVTLEDAQRNNPGLTVELEDDELNWVITLDNFYSVVKQKQGDHINLAGFIDYVVKERNLKVQEAPTPQAPVMDRQIETTQTEIEAKKKENVERIKKIKEQQEAQVELRKKAVLKDRCGDLKATITELNPVCLEIFETINLVIESSPELSYKEKIEQITELTQQDPVFIRMLVQVYKINTQLKQDENALTIMHTEEEEEITTLSSDRKKHLFSNAVAHLDLVAAHTQVRDYSIFELIITMLDYCEKTSSLTITDTPESIAVLASGIYDILVNKDLNRDFVYAPDSTNTLLENDANWFKTNSIFQSYLRKIPYTVAMECMNDSVKDLMKILDIVGSRDLLFANQRLTPDNMVELFNITSNMFNSAHQTGQCYSYRYKKNDNMLLAIVSKLKNGITICIVADDNGVLSYVQYANGRTYQQHHSNDTANVVIKWLENIIPLSRV